jgi:hypothetical protein
MKGLEYGCHQLWWGIYKKGKWATGKWVMKNNDPLKGSF